MVAGSDKSLLPQLSEKIYFPVRCGMYGPVQEDEALQGCRAQKARKARTNEVQHLSKCPPCSLMLRKAPLLLLCGLTPVSARLELCGDKSSGYVLVP